MKYLTLLPLLFLIGCGDTYRYPCQDPNNWEKQECKKPYCNANGTCPEDLRHYERQNYQQPYQQQAPNMPSKGECK